MQKRLRRGGKNTQKNYTKKVLITQTTMMVWSFTYSLECEVKWALGSITKNKASTGKGVPAELFQILKDDILKCCTQYVSKFGKSRSGLRTKKGQFSFQSQRKATKEGSNYHTISLILNVRKVMFKILQARLQQSVREPRTS